VTARIHAVNDVVLGLLNLQPPGGTAHSRAATSSPSLEDIHLERIRVDEDAIATVLEADHQVRVRLE